MSLPITSVDWATSVVTITGNLPIYARSESTSGDVAEKYDEYMQSIATVFNKPSGTALSAADVSTVTAALQGLYQLAGQGLPNADGSTSFLNTNMASDLDVLAKSFVATGFSIPPVGAIGFAGVAGSNPDQTAAINAWKDLSVVSPIVTNTLQSALDNINTNGSLQAMIELQYVKTANDLVEQKLSDLQDALANVKGSVDVLAAIQDLHNKIQISSKPSIGFKYNSQYGGNNGKDYTNSYNARASNYFGGPVTAKVAFTIYITGSNPLALTPAASNFVDQLIKLRASLITQINFLDRTLTADQKAATGNLYTALNTVLTDLNTAFASGATPITAISTVAQKNDGIKNWLIDNYNNTQTSSAGLMQQNITKAITASQSLNQTQTENVKNYLFVFEQYYQSASSILQSITQMIQKMAQGIRS